MPEMQELFWLDNRILGTVDHDYEGRAIFSAFGDQRNAVSRYSTMLISTCPETRADEIARFVQRVRPVPHLERERHIAAARTIGKPWEGKSNV